VKINVPKQKKLTRGQPGDRKYSGNVFREQHIATEECGDKNFPFSSTKVHDDVKILIVNLMLLR